MANAAQEMSEHVGLAYKDAVDNILFLKRQQWLATNLTTSCFYTRLFS
jgi:hypothetical protein